ncbi:MAG: protein disulfide oxidoreductase [Actinomycetia bacterium]|nr:protein disulfide oxidoreductase [Actinomycetes bacterium]
MIAVLAATAIVATACGSSSETDSTAEPTPSAAATTSAAAATTAPVDSPPAVPAQLQFNSTTISGEPFSGETLAGKPAVLWFWAPHCPTCQREAPMVGQIADANPNVTFLGVAGIDELPAMKEFVEKYPIDQFTQIADTDGDVWMKFGVTKQPAWAFVSADGTVDVVKGTLPEPELQERVTALSTS